MMMTVDSRQWFFLALTAVFLWLIYLLAPVITPFVISAALAYLGDPVVDRLESVSIRKWSMGRTLAVSIVFILMTGGVFLLFLIVFPLLQEQAERLVQRVPAALEWFAGTVIPWLQAKLGLQEMSFDTETIAHALQSYWKEFSTTTLSVLGTVSRSGQAVLGWLMNLVLIPVVTFYLLRDWDLLIKGIRSLLPRKNEATVVQLAREIDEVLGAFVRGQLLVMIALGAIYTTGLLLLGLDLAFIIGMGAGLLSIVPYLGTIVGLVAAVLAAAFQFQDLFHMVMVLLVFAVGQSLEGMVLTPKLVGDRIGLHPVAVIFAILAGGQLFGFLGILLALPVTSALNVLVRHLRDKYKNSDLYHEDTALKE
jgi:predicted PurR-regulated permease PerM